MKLDDGKIISLSERLSTFLADHGDCGGPLDTVRTGSLVTLTCGECGRSFSYAARVPERSADELVKALDRLAQAVEATGSASSKSETAASLARGLKAEEAVDTTWTPEPPSPPPLRRRRLAPPGPFAPRPRRRGAPVPESEDTRRPPRRNPLAAVRVRAGTSYRLRRLRRGAMRVVDQAGTRRREIALTALGLAGAYVIIALGSGAETSSSRPGEAVQGAPLSALVESGASGTVTSATEAQPLATPDNPPPPVTRDRVTVLRGRVSVVLPNGWRRAAPLGGSAVLRAPDGTARVVILPAALNGASGETPAKAVRVRGKRYVAILRRSANASESALDGANLVLRSLRPTG